MKIINFIFSKEVIGASISGLVGVFITQFIHYSNKKEKKKAVKYSLLNDLEYGENLINGFASFQDEVGGYPMVHNKFPEREDFIEYRTLLNYLTNEEIKMIEGIFRDFSSWNNFLDSAIENNKVGNHKEKERMLGMFWGQLTQSSEDKIEKIEEAKNIIQNKDNLFTKIKYYFKKH